MQCQVCGNEYEGAFIVTIDDETLIFDCFECAIHQLARSCAHCGCRVIGHGVEDSTGIYCCQHCVEMAQAKLDTSSAD